MSRSILGGIQLYATENNWCNFCPHAEKRSPKYSPRQVRPLGTLTSQTRTHYKTLKSQRLYVLLRP